MLQGLDISSNRDLFIKTALQIPYKDEGRNRYGCDCYGLVRLIRYNLRGDLLKLFDKVSPRNKTVLSQQVTYHKRFFKPVEHLIDGTIVLVSIQNIAMHLGICMYDSAQNLKIIETNQRTGVTVSSRETIESKYLNVAYYDN